MPVDLLGVLSSEPAQWTSEIAVLDDAAKSELGAWLVREWIEGRLEPRLLAAPADQAARTVLRRQLAAAVTALGVDEMDVEWGPQVDDAIAARWCWITPWILMSQDEDLFLMADHLVAALLGEASAGCPKRDYAIAIVQHHVRDQAHAALARGPDAVRSRLAELATFAGPARVAGASDLVAYLERLASYARPQKLTELDARVRILDLWRCHAPATVELVRQGSEWRACVDPHPQVERWICVDARTGALRLDSVGQDRANSKARHRAR
jgi:hypothetical protein